MNAFQISLHDQLLLNFNIKTSSSLNPKQFCYKVFCDHYQFYYNIFNKQFKLHFYLELILYHLIILVWKSSQMIFSYHLIWFTNTHNSPHGRSIEIPRERGGGQKQKFFKKSVKLNWNFWRGERVQTKTKNLVGVGVGVGTGYFLETHNNENDSNQIVTVHHTMIMNMVLWIN